MKFSPYGWSEADMIGGDAALDFINTASGWTGDELTDRLGGMEGFADWAALAGLANEKEAGALKAEARKAPKEAARAFEEGMVLRAALWRLVAAIAAGKKADKRDLSILKSWARAGAAHQDLVPTRTGFELAFSGETPVFAAPFYKIALSAEKLLTEGRLERLHICGGENCEWAFLDASKNGKRRWCSMATCGNDAKVKKFRKRTKKTAAGLDPGQ
ncbi:MAG: CGNR zinc finger domain-containing protein [Parvularculaceae bacterium]